MAGPIETIKNIRLKVKETIADFNETKHEIQQQTAYGNRVRNVEGIDPAVREAVAQIADAAPKQSSFSYSSISGESDRGAVIVNDFTDKVVNHNDHIGISFEDMQAGRLGKTGIDPNHHGSAGFSIAAAVDSLPEGALTKQIVAIVQNEHVPQDQRLSEQDIKDLVHKMKVRDNEIKEETKGMDARTVRVTSAINEPESKLAIAINTGLDAAIVPPKTPLVPKEKQTQAQLHK